MFQMSDKPTKMKPVTNDIVMTPIAKVKCETNVTVSLPKDTDVKRASNSVNNVVKQKISAVTNVAEPTFNDPSIPPSINF